jgi:predicted ATP-binding protein involved in virulence
MRIDRLLVENFKGFERREFAFHPEFNLVVGENGSGKSSVLDALAVATGGWLSGVPGYGNRSIEPDEMRLLEFLSDSGTHWEPQAPSTIEAWGLVQEQAVSWWRSARRKSAHSNVLGM